MTLLEWQTYAINYKVEQEILNDIASYDGDKVTIGLINLIVETFYNKTIKQIDNIESEDK